MEKIKEFFNEISANTRLKAEARALGGSPSFESVATLASNWGYIFTPNELRRYYATIQDYELSSDELETISGSGSNWFIPFFGDGSGD